MTRFFWLVFVLAPALISPSLAGADAVPAGQATAAIDVHVASAANGQRLFVKDACYFCHGYAGQGGRDGARIAATTLSAQALIRYLRRPFGSMPAFTAKVISDQDVMDIQAYLLSLSAAKRAKDIPLLDQLRDK
jgi:mono/diheme cytochrome c family protein